MKRIFFTITLSLLFLNFNKLTAQCSLDQIGGVNTVTASALSDMTAASGGTVYTVSYHSTLNKIFLHSVSIAGSYTTVASISTATTIKPIVKINKANGKVYVVIRDENTGKVGKVFYLSGSSLIQLGPAFSGTNIVTDLSISFNSLGEEYVAYTDANNGNKSTVKKWDGVSSWVSVGTGTVSSGAGYFNSLVIDKTDSPVLAYQSVADGSITAVSKFSGTWIPVGTGTVGLGAANSKIKVASNGDYYLGYTELSGKVIVQKYNGTWTPLGSPVSAMSFTANTFDLDLDPVDMPYFISQNNTSYYAVGYKYTGVPTWSNVIGGNLSAVSSGNLNVSIDNTGNPYFFYVDQSNGSGLNIKTITSPVSISTQPISVTRCNGQSGSFSIGTSGGAPNSYQWQTSTGLNFINSSAPYSGFNTNTLSFTSNPSMNQNKLRCVVDLGCKNNISNAAILTVSSTTITPTTTNPTCFNTNDGAIITSVSGGIAPYSYFWNTGATTPSITSLYWNTYTLNVIDNASCTTTTVVTLTSPPSISTSFSGNMNICSGSNTTLTITATGGTPGYTYSWSPSGSLNTTSSSVVIATPGSSQTYNVSVTDAIGCVATDTVMVNVNPLPTVSASNSTICAGNIATLNATGSAHTYTWNPGNLIGATQNVNPGTTTTYTVVGTNTLTGCTNYATALVTVNPLPTVNAGPSQTLTCSNTTLTLSGSTTGGVTYSWTGPGIVSGSTTLNPVINAPGTYDLSVTSAAGCFAGPAPVSISQDIIAPTTNTNVSGVLNCTLTSVNASATTTSTPVSYNWTGTGITSATNISTITVNAGGIKNYTVTNTSNGCATVGNLNVSQNLLAPACTASSTGTVTCLTNTIQLNGTPSTGVTYTWTAPGGSSIFSGTNSQNAIGSGAGVYTLNVQSLSSGCTNGATVSVNQNTIAPSVSPSVTNTLTCLNTTVNAIVTTTTSPVTYTWTGAGIISGATTATITTSAGGIKNYSVTNTNNGCISSGTIAVTQNTTSPSPTAANSGTLTCNTPTVNLTGSGGGTYLWSGPGIISGSTTAVPVVNLPGCYNLTVTAANSCTAIATTCVSQNTISPSVTGSVNGTITCSNSFVNSIATTTTSPVSYNWSGTGIVSGAGTATITVNTGGIKNYTVTNSSNGCQTTGTLSISQNTTSPIGLTAGANQTITCASPSVTLNGNISAPGNATFNWTGGVCGSTTNSITSACAAGVYTLTATDPFNGCTSSSTVQVLVNAGVPVISSSSNGTLTCVNINVNAIATTTVSTVDYLWSGPGIISGATTATVTVNQPGNYSVTVTNTVSGCSANSVVNITQDIVVPTLTLSASPSTICAGSSSTLSATGSASVTYNWLPGSLSGAIQTVSPSSSSQYTATATNSINGCVSSETISLVVNSNPTITVSGNMNICKGSSTNLTANGATSYTWGSGANTASISVSPTITTTYSVDGDNGNGCVGSLTVAVAIIPNKTINGVITNTTGATGGDLTLYRYTSFLSHWDSVTTIPLSSSYSFNNIDSALYVIRAVPSATNIQVTYADSSISWQGATIINHGCTNNTSQNIKLIALQNFILGPGVITGTIVEGNGFVPKTSNEFKPLFPGTPIGGIVVKGGKNPGGQMFVQTTTNAAGQYTLSGLPLNTGNESYFVFVDIPGLDTNGTYHVVISGPDTVYTGLNFNVDSMYINPIGTITGISTDKSVLDNKITLFPNPANQKFTIEYELTQPANVLIELYDVIGHKIKTISPNSFEEKNKHSHFVNIEDLSNGVYFIKIKFNDSETPIKLIKYN